MANEVSVTVEATTDADQVIERVADSATQAGNQIERAMADTEQAFDTAARASGRLGESLDTASGSFSQLSGGVGDIGGSMTAFTDLQNLSANRALAQEQANVALKRAQQDYNDAVKEYGANSLEAEEAQAALNQARQDAKPPTDIQKWGENLELISPLIMAAVGATDLLLLANTALHASFVKNTAAAIASRVATLANAAATGIATAAQWLWNAAFAASGIGLIILAVAALVAGIIYLATQTQFFQKLWEVVWNAVKIAFEATFNFIKSYYEFVFNALMGALRAVRDFFVSAFKFAIDTVVNYFQFIYSIPGRVVDVFANIANAITAPFKAAFNFIARAWNYTVGSLSFTIPDWVPGLGGAGFSMPHLPTFATGGDVLRTGAAIIHKGERIVPAAAAQLIGSNGRGATVEVRFVGAEGEFRRWMQKNTRVFGGGGSNSVQVAWGS